MANRSNCIDHGQKGDKEGYGSTVRHIDGKRKYIRMHRARFFDANGYWPDVVRHTCDNPRCVNPEHLIPGTIADNNHDRAERGRNANVNGTRNPMARLTTEQCDAIRTSSAKPKELAVMYGVNVRHIYRIKSGERRCQA